MNKKPDNTQDTTHHHSPNGQSPNRETPNSEVPARETMRIAKAIARAGICSRRDAENYIADGRVTVNGKKISSPALNVTASDKVSVDGKPLPDQEPVKIWRYHKPKGLVTTAKDEKDRDTIFSKLPDDLPRTITIGRLDINTEGLLLLTNDGELARHLELPKTGWLRRYKVRAKGSISQDKLNDLSKGITVEGIKYGPIQAQLIKEQGSNCWFTMGLREGKNREIKRICEHLGLSVNRLIRLSFGPFMLGDLKAGEVEDIKPHILADQLGPELSSKFNIKPSTNQAKSKRVTPSKPTSKSKFSKSKSSNQDDRGNRFDKEKTGKPPHKRGGKPGPKNGAPASGRRPPRRIKP